MECLAKFMSVSEKLASFDLSFDAAQIYFGNAFRKTLQASLPSKALQMLLSPHQVRRSWIMAQHSTLGQGACIFTLFPVFLHTLP